MIHLSAATPMRALMTAPASANANANADSIAELEELMLHTFQVPLAEGPYLLHKRDIRTHPDRATRIVRLSEIEDKLTRWRLEDHPSPADRKAWITPLQAIIIMQAHMSARRGLTFREMAVTLADNELRSIDFDALGIINDNASVTALYQRLWRAVQVLMTLVDATPGPR